MKTNVGEVNSSCRYFEFQESYITVIRDPKEQHYQLRLE